MDRSVQSWCERRTGDTASRIAGRERQFILRFRIAVGLYWGVFDGAGDQFVARRNCLSDERLRQFG